VPVTVRTYVPATVAEHETFAVPAPVTELGVTVLHVRPAGTVSVSVTTPVNPFNAVTVTVLVADNPTFTAVGEDATIVKSTKLNVAVVV
jgi:hypothetical protein